MITDAGKYGDGWEMLLQEAHYSIEGGHVVARALVPHVMGRNVAGEENEVGRESCGKGQRGVDYVEGRVTRVVTPFASEFSLCSSRQNLRARPVVGSAAHWMVAIGDAADGIVGVPVDVGNDGEVADV